MARGFAVNGRGFVSGGRGLEVGPTGPSLPDGTKLSSVGSQESFETDLGNWTRAMGDTDNIRRSTNLGGYDGSYSLEFNRVSSDIAAVHSNTATPSEAMVDTYYFWRTDYDNPYNGAVFRYQDSSNFYVASFEPRVPELRLEKLVGGTHTHIGTVSLSSFNTQWQHLRFHGYEEGGSFKFLCRWEDSGWNTLGTIEDTANDLSGGGQVGFGNMAGQNSAFTSRAAVDVIEVFTP